MGKHIYRILKPGGSLIVYGYGNCVLDNDKGNRVIQRVSVDMASSSNQKRHRFLYVEHGNWHLLGTCVVQYIARPLAVQCHTQNILVACLRCIFSTEFNIGSFSLIFSLSVFPSSTDMIFMATGTPGDAILTTCARKYVFRFQDGQGKRNDSSLLMLIIAYPSIDGNNFSLVSKILRMIMSSSIVGKQKVLNLIGFSFPLI